MLKLRTKITLLVCSVIAAILILNQYPVSMSLRQTVMETSGSALLDVARQCSVALSHSMQMGDYSALPELAAQAQECTNCTGIAILDRSGEVCYNSPGHEIEPSVLEQYGSSLPGEMEYKIQNNKDGVTTIYAVAPIEGPQGETLGRVVAKLQHEQIPSGLQKAQRELNTMTLLVMLIALLFVWDLTDNIKGTMFNLEPVEIAQLLVERNALIDAVRDGILSVDAQGKIIHVNRTAMKLCRQSLEQFDPKTDSFSRIFPNNSLDHLIHCDHPLYDHECLIGRDWYYVNFVPIKVEQPKHESLLITFRPKQEVVRFAEDITGVKSYIEALRGQMHEFNNKLQVVAGLVQGKNYEQLGQYVNSLIHLKNREMVEINKKIKDPILAAFLLSKFDRAAEQKVDLILTDHSEVRSKLSQEFLQDLVVIVGNLLENAFDAVQNSGMRTVTLELMETGAELSVSVWNSGPPIPQNLIEKLFDYGVTTKEEGHGIGLYLVRQACNRYNGYTTVVSDPKDGTEFTTHIPIPEKTGGELCTEC
ncbi:ATP-binding protein [Lawsonibacter sp. LCP25S3_G6]|uniref:ATP-binding protein n=1 Tax=unclassified Lawsonibacter TaxID=2617946 RepID=UPI003F9C6BB9